MSKNNLFQSLINPFKTGVAENVQAVNTFELVGRVVPDSRRCVQCGVCSYNCPIGIPVRDYARQGLPVELADCITCGQCIQVCPRGTLRWETKTRAYH